MDIIKLENASSDAIKHILKTFVKSNKFFPREIDIQKIISDDFNIEENSKKDIISFIYGTTKNLVDFHLSYISRKIEEHPKIGSDLIESFNNERNFLNTLYSPATTMKKDNFYYFGEDKIIIDPNFFINEHKFKKVEEDLLDLFHKQLNLFKNNTVFDLMIYQIDDNIDDTYFIKSKGLDFIEDKNVLRNKNELTNKYIDNIFKSFDFFKFNDEECINISTSLDKFLNERYYKNNRDDLLEHFSVKLGDFLSLPGFIEIYDEKNLSTLNNFNWNNFFSYADNDQLERCLNILFKTDNAKEDFIFMKNSNDYDISVELSKRKTLLGSAFKHLYEIKNENNQLHIIDTIDKIERLIDKEVDKLPEISNGKNKEKVKTLQLK